jgi:signal transduction histidine kinase
MRLPDRSAGAPPPPWTRLVRIAVTGVVCAALVLAAGWLSERLVLGPDEAAARERTEAEVRAAFDSMARELRLMALGVADGDSVVAASADDVTATRRLFAAAEGAVVTDEEAEVALTVYDLNGRPLAWDGRPSELPPDRLQGAEAWFFAQGALGLRLVYVAPVTTAAGQRVGTVAAERSLSSAAASRAEADAFRYDSRLAPVSIELRFEAARTTPAAGTFDVEAPSGARLFTATLDATDLARTRDRWRRASWSLAVITLALTLALLAGPLLDWRNRLTGGASYASAVATVAGTIVASRALLRLASPADWLDSPLFSGTEYASPLLRPFLSSPFDFLITGVAAGSLVALLLYAVEAWRLTRWHRRRRVTGARATAAFVAVQLAAGAALAALLALHQAFLRDTVANTSLDLLRFSLHPWSLPRLALQVGLIVWHATTLGCGVLILRAAVAGWAVPRPDTRLRAAMIAFWALPVVVWQLAVGVPAPQQLPPLIAASVTIALVIYATRLKARYLHGSQAFRLTLMTLGLLVPAFAFYPSMFQLGWQAKSQLVETRYAPQAINQRQTVQRLMQESLAQIDQFPGLAELATAPLAPGEAATDRAFQVWRVTGLAMYPVTSSVELYGADGLLTSRFAFNLPEDLTAVPRSDEETCDWAIYEGVSPFFAEERRILHAGHAFCDAQGRPVGSIVVHAILDYANLPFSLSQNPYVELMRPADPLRGEGISGRDVEFAFYGWSRTPLYASNVTAWPLEDAVFARIEESRTPIWAELRRGDIEYDVYILNNRGGIYALGFPIASPFDHLVNLAELTVVAWVTYLLLVAVTALHGAFSRRGTTARALLREIRASFYRKLLLAFILAVVVPVAALAVATRTYVADEMRANVEQEAVRTASAARRVVEDLVVWVSRLIDQDVNIFSGPRLLATSERNLFASGVLPTRTPADVYRALELENAATVVVREQVGALSYLVAGTSMGIRGLDAMLTVPLTSRELQIEGQIDTLDRRVLLGALFFVFCGAGIGYWLAERIADPVNRLTRATRRLARGDLDVRIAATSSDELRRLVQDFNRMAGELQRQQKELEQTHRLQAWAEMASQVAHEIKNPLTPIQLNAEHLRRVHADRGQPLSPVLEECVGTILTQVKLLRQIASEFSSFASSPAVRPAPVAVPELVHQVVDPYQIGLRDRIQFSVDVPDTLPPVYVDRTLVGRSLTNIVENALHAMPAAGVLTIVARAVDSVVRIRVSDTGVGMDTAALERAFEPYFSTKSTGTGLGLPIAKRNVELNGGTIAVTSERDRGTTVELTLPVAPSG